MCAMIFAAKEMNEEWVLGFDPFVPFVGDKADIPANSGRGNHYPMGPVCEFQGKEVATFVDALKMVKSQGPCCLKCFDT